MFNICNCTCKQNVQTNPYTFWERTFKCYEWVLVLLIWRRVWKSGFNYKQVFGYELTNASG